MCPSLDVSLSVDSVIDLYSRDEIKVKLYTINAINVKRDVPNKNRILTFSNDGDCHKLLGVS